MDASVNRLKRIRGFDALSKKSGPRFRGTCASKRFRELAAVDAPAVTKLVEGRDC